MQVLGKRASKARNSLNCITVFNEKVHKPSCEASDVRQNGPTCSEISSKFYNFHSSAELQFPNGCCGPAAVLLHGSNMAEFMLVLSSLICSAGAVCLHTKHSRLSVAYVQPY